VSFDRSQDGLNHLEMTYAWNNIILPGTGTWQGADQREKHFSYDLKHLSNDASYEAQVLAVTEKNKSWGQCYVQNFLRFSAKKLAFFSKTNVRIQILHNLALF
jgi:hypothetical protein